jgi:hypothetical protein
MRLLGSGLAVALVAACSGGSSPAASCKSVPTTCESLSYDVPTCLYANCTRKFTCTGTASCAGAFVGDSCFPELNCTNSHQGCTWTGTDCVGTPLPCTDPSYQQNSVGCANVGCTLTVTCTGGEASYDCSLQTTESECGMYSPFCAWQ